MEILVLGQIQAAIILISMQELRAPLKHLARPIIEEINKQIPTMTVGIICQKNIFQKIQSKLRNIEVLVIKTPHPTSHNLIVG